MERIALVRAVYDALNADDVDRFVEHIDPANDFEFHTSGLYPGLSPVYRGPAGLRRFWAEFRGTWHELRLALADVRETGDRLVALYEFQARGRDGLEVRRQSANVFTFEGDRIARITAHGDWQEALDVAVYP